MAAKDCGSPCGGRQATWPSTVTSLASQCGGRCWPRAPKKCLEPWYWTLTFSPRSPLGPGSPCAGGKGETESAERSEPKQEKCLARPAPARPVRLAPALTRSRGPPTWREGAP